MQYFHRILDYMKLFIFLFFSLSCCVSYADVLGDMLNKTMYIDTQMNRVLYSKWQLANA